MNATNEYEEQFGRILDLLEQHEPRRLSISMIARTLGMSRPSIAKYLAVLSAIGSVSFERFGRSKLYRRTTRIPPAELFESLPNATVILDGDLQISMVNRRFKTMLNIRQERNLAGIPIFDLDFPVFSEPVIQQNIERFSWSETGLETMQITDEWTDRVYLVEFAAIVSHAGPGVMVSIRDITALKKAETALKDSEQKVATLFETVPSGIIIFTADGTILDANPAALRILGLRSFGQFSAASIFTLACVTGTIEALIAKGRETETEIACNFDRMKQEQVPTVKSGVVYFDVVFTPIRRETGGPPDEFAILFKDITKDRREREELIFRETRYRGFFEDTCNGVLVVEPHGGDGDIIKDLNRVAVETLRVRREDVIGRKILDVFPDLGTAANRELERKVLATGKPAFLPPIRYRNNENLWIRHYLFRIPSGELASFMIDVSEELQDETGWSPGRGEQDPRSAARSI
ncbi:MAG: PAS domain-containing protein [Sphaerochaetaceae bacterium]